MPKQMPETSDAETIPLFIAPTVGALTTVLLAEEMVRAMRAYHEDAPSATNHDLADRVEALLREGVREITGECVQVCGREIDLPSGTIRALEADELLWLRCLQLSEDPQQLVVFSARDCRLPLLNNDPL